MTGVASRYVGRYIGVILILLGLFPGGRTAAADPGAGAGGATMVMFGCVVAAGIRIITQTPLTRRDVLIVGWRLARVLAWSRCRRFQPFSADGRRSVRFGGHQRWAGSDSAEPYSAAGAGGDEIVKESG